MQGVVDHTDILIDMSSDDGSSMLSVAHVKQESSSANGGLPWDLSGEPVDYSLKVPILRCSALL
jgi:hypothetical protein